MPELGETGLRSLSLGVESFGDTTNLGLHTGVDDYNSCSTFGNLRSGEDETDSVTAVSVYYIAWMKGLTRQDNPPLQWAPPAWLQVAILR